VIRIRIKFTHRYSIA